MSPAPYITEKSSGGTDQDIRTMALPQHRGDNQKVIALYLSHTISHPSQSSAKGGGGRGVGEGGGGCSKYK